MAAQQLYLTWPDHKAAAPITAMKTRNKIEAMSMALHERDLKWGGAASRAD